MCTVVLGSIDKGHHAGRCTQVHWLTLDAALAPSAVGLFSQLPQAQTTAYQVNMTVSQSRCCCSTDGRSIDGGERDTMRQATLWIGCHCRALPLRTVLHCPVQNTLMTLGHTLATSAHTMYPSDSWFAGV